MARPPSARLQSGGAPPSAGARLCHRAIANLLGNVLGADRYGNQWNAGDIEAEEARSGSVEQGERRDPGDMEQHQKQFKLLSLLYPLLWTVARMDALLPLQQGYKLIVRARL